jgi:hypothetical protein
MKIYTKEELINKLKEIRAMGWIKNLRPGNVGGVGNTLEELLEIDENNLPIPNSAEWELKCQRSGSSSLTTLFHMEPSPRALRFVPSIFLLKYGWRHQEAGKSYSESEMSFRQTIGGHNRSDRGFKVCIDRNLQKVLISFDYKSIDERHSLWLKDVERRVGLGELDPQPYWGFNDLHHKAGTKLVNCFYVKAEVKKEKNNEYYFYKDILMLQKFDFDKFLIGLENNDILVDFDARTGHNHGTKFRLRQNKIHELYKVVKSF